MFWLHRRDELSNYKFLMCSEACEREKKALIETKIHHSNLCYHESVK